MGNYYVKAGTVFDDPACKFYVYVSLAGYDEDDYTTVDDSDIVADDPYLIMGGTGGEKEVVIGLDSNYRIRITNTGIEAWDEGSSAWVDLIAGGIAGNIFKEIDCPAGTNPVAVGPIDTLVLTSGNNILTITGDNATNTINFVVVEGNITHNNLGSIDAGDIKHLTAAQLAALHAKSHAHDGADGSGTVAHSDTTGKGTDDHHNKSHAHDGVDGSGTVAHSDTTGKTIDDHHARDHDNTEHTTNYLAEVVEDTTPQLGGDLDLNGNNLDFPTTPNISDVKDEDDMASDSATMLATQQSIAAFVREFFAVIVDPTGFPNETDSVLSFDAGNRKFTINRTGASFDIWQSGIRTTITTDDVVDDNYIIIADISGTHFIYYDSGVLAELVNPSEDDFDDAMITKVLVALVYWNANDGAAYILGEERHGTIMSGRTHEWLHDLHGVVWDSGLTLSDYVEDTDDDPSLTFKIEDGEIYDEDISINIVDGDPLNKYEQQLSGADAEIPIMYRDDTDGSWTEDAATTLPYKSLGAGRLAYNKDDGDGTFSQVEVTDNAFVSMTIVATNDWQYPIKAIQGQNDYADKRTAIEDATSEVLSLGDLPTPEMVFLFRLVLNTKDTFGGTKKAKIVSVVDFRASTIKGISNLAQDHGTLAGLGDDDHPQYLLVTDIDDIAVDAETAQPISSNWAYDHKESPADINHLTDAQVAALHTRLHSIVDALDHSMGNDKILYSTGAGVPTELVHGDAGKYLKSQGLGAALLWDTPAGGGGLTDWYDVATDGEIDTAVAAIQTDNVIGTIRLTADISLDSTLTFNDASAGFILDLNGYTLDPNGDNTVLDVINALFCVIKNGTIDATDLTTAAREIIDIDEASDNPVLIDNIHITGDGTNGIGVNITSNNVTVRNSFIDNIAFGIINDGNSYCYILNNTFKDIAQMGTQKTAAGTNRYINIIGNIFDTIPLGISFASSGGYTYNSLISNNIFIGIGTNSPLYLEYMYRMTISDNNIENPVTITNIIHFRQKCYYCTVEGNIVYDADTTQGFNLGAIYIGGDSDYNVVTGNMIYGMTNAGAGSGIGCFIEHNTCLENTVVGNTFLGCDTNYTDGGTNTFEDANNRA